MPSTKMSYLLSVELNNVNTCVGLQSAMDALKCDGSR